VNDAQPGGLRSGYFDFGVVNGIRRDADRAQPDRIGRSPRSILARVLESCGAGDVAVVLTGGTLGLTVYAAAFRVIFPASCREFFRFARACFAHGKPAPAAAA
jgi:hypothetical protein